MNESNALVAQHTVALPALTFEQAVRLLEAFNTAHLATPPAQLPKLVAQDSRLQDAALAFFIYRFTAASPQLPDPGHSLKLAADVAGGALRFGDDAHKQALLEQVVFNVAHPAGHQALSAVVRSALPAAEVERALLAHAASANELHLHNALELPKWLFGPRYPLSQSGRLQLQQRVEGLKGKPGLNAVLQQAVTSFRLPD
ncbi:MAG: hypothetical protein IPJ65_24995 [Archangiaceae bacterium]|nr:hypothetical protein [Archangiaceae bacterium]